MKERNGKEIEAMSRLMLHRIASLLLVQSFDYSPLFWTVPVGGI
jgi:hypothetical protein